MATRQQDISTIVRTLASGQGVDIGRAWTFLHVRSANDELHVIPEGGAPTLMAQGDKIRLPDGEIRDGFRVENNTGASVTFTIVCGFGDYIQSATVADVTLLRGTTLTPGRASAGVAAAVILAQNDDRRAVRIKNTHATQTLYLGTDNTVTAANGYPVAPGETVLLSESPGSAIWGIASGADTTYAYLVEA